MDATNTPILHIDYTGPMGDRTTAFRFQAGTDSATAAQAWRDTFWLSWQSILSDTCSVSQGRWQEQGSNFTLPIVLPTGPYVGLNADNFDEREYPNFVSLIGRGTVSGRRVRAFFYGIPFQGASDYRFQQGEFSPLDNLRGAMINLRNLGGWRTIAGDLAGVYNYANFGVNAYYQRKART